MALRHPHPLASTWPSQKPVDRCLQPHRPQSTFFHRRRYYVTPQLQFRISTSLKSAPIGPPVTQQHFSPTNALNQNSAGSRFAADLQRANCVDRRMARTVSISRFRALRPLRRSREAQNFPRLLREDMANKIVFVQPLHDGGDRALPLVVEPAVVR